MRLTKHRRKTLAAMDMTPMIDITFQLLIFFMTCSHISQVNKEQEIELPQLEGSADQQEEVTLIANINAEGDIKVSGKPLSITEFVGIVGDELAGVENEPSRVHVVLRADRNGNCRTVNQVVSALAAQRITQVRIAVEAGR